MIHHTQMSARKGIQCFGKVAVNALYMEFVQLNDKAVFNAIDASLLMEEEKRGALEAISVIKEKRCGKIKGQTVANGSQQKGLYPKSASASPTVSLDTLLLSLLAVSLDAPLLSLLVDAKENRHVACADIAGAYLNADMDDKVLVVKFIGEEVDIMRRVNPEFAKHVLYEGKKGKTKVPPVRTPGQGTLWVHPISTSLVQAFCLDPKKYQFQD